MSNVSRCLVQGAALAGLALTVACGSSSSGSTTTLGATTGLPATTGTGGSGGSGGSTSGTGGEGGFVPAVGPKVFLILFENHDWSAVKGNSSAPYLQTLLPLGAHAEQYFNPPGNHPSEPNYIWLEAGDNLGVVTDLPPSFNSQTTTDHLTAYLEKAHFTWKSYQEDISGTDCPLGTENEYAPKHNPPVFFTDMTDDNSTTSAKCIAHMRPYTELAADLAANTVANYNLLTPNLCHDMHGDPGCPSGQDDVKVADDWLSVEIPKLMASQAYLDGATIFITWDESGMNDQAVYTDAPIGFIALGKNVKVGYQNQIKYTHSSTLRTVEDMFGLQPYLRDAAKATNLSDLFTTLPVAPAQ